MQETGQVASLLYASEPGIYGRFGYAPAGSTMNATLRRGPGLFRSTDVDCGVTIDGVGAEDARSIALSMYETHRARRNGMVELAGRWLTSLLADSAESRGQSSDDLSLDIRELGAAYLGSPRSLRRSFTAGRVIEHRPGSVAELCAAMSSEHQPWVPIASKR